MAHAMAMDNPRIAADVIEVQEFPTLGQRYFITGVPKTIINETVQFVGAVPESVFVDKVLEAVGLISEGDKGPSEEQRPQRTDSGPQSAVSL